MLDGISLATDFTQFNKTGWTHDLCPFHEYTPVIRIISCNSLEERDYIDCSKSEEIDFTEEITHRLKVCYKNQYRSYVGNYNPRNHEYVHHVFDVDGYKVKLKDEIPLADFGNV